MIQTSYFAKYKGDSGISIATSQPNGCNYPVFHELVPDKSLVWAYKDGKITEEEYTTVYMNQLNQLDVHKIAKELEGKVLLCWEGKQKFCHRHIVADWFNKNGIPCKEQHTTELYFEPMVIPQTCLYCMYSNLDISNYSYTFECTNKDSKHFGKRTKKPQKSKCKRWEAKF